MPESHRSFVTDVVGFFDEATNTVSYLVRDPRSKSCAIIDSVLDFDYASGSLNHRSTASVIDFVMTNGLTVEWIIETHNPCRRPIR